MAIKNILVIDDSATDAHLLTEMLKKNGYAVTTAASGEEGIAKAKQEKPGPLPFCTFFLPPTAGSGSGHPPAIPVIICSTKGQETDKAWGLRQGARDYLVKPITEKDLIGKIKSL